MIEMSILESLNTIVVVPIIVGLVEVGKRVGIPHRFVPLLSIILGIVIAFLFGYKDTIVTNNIIAGIVYGLSASGLYSGTKTLTNRDQTSEI